MRIRHWAWGAALTAALSVTLVAQQAPTGYHNITCVKVKPGKGADFRSMINGDVRKLEQSRADSGTISGYIVLRTMMPAGADAQCDYVFVTFYPGLPTAPMSDDEMTAALQKAGVSANLQEWGAEHEAVGSLVYNDITRYQVLVGRAKQGDYLVFNSMSVPSVRDWVAFEERVWQPFAEAAVKDGAESGWALNVQVFPNGAKDAHLVSTVDIYPSWEAAFGNPGFMDRWKRVHPDLDFRDAMAQADKVRTIESTVLYKVENIIEAPK